MEFLQLMKPLVQKWEQPTFGSGVMMEACGDHIRMNIAGSTIIAFKTFYLVFLFLGLLTQVKMEEKRKPI